MTRFSLTAPGKAFIAGEYLAMKDGPSLAMATSPRFQLNISADDRASAEKNIFHPLSPAGLFIQENRSIFNHWNFEFIDPYLGRGGFGASTAQFLLSYAWLEIVKKIPLDEFKNGFGKNCHLHLAASLGSINSVKFSSSDLEFEIAINEMLEVYKGFAYSGVGFPPSGADLVSQALGRFCFFDRKSSAYHTGDWPFEDLSLIFVPTGVKLPTHEHLAQLSDFNEAELFDAFSIIHESWLEKNSLKFCEGISLYRKALVNLHFEAQTCSDLIAKISKISGVKTAKGCGALGADIILLVVDKGERNLILQKIFSLGFKNLVTDSDLSGGLSI